MNDKNTSGNEEVDSLANRTVRALEEPMTVLTTDMMPVEDQDTSIVTVTSHTGNEYTVDVREGRCSCPDQKHRAPDNGCKHLRRARIALGRDSIAAATIAALEIDPALGDNCPGPAVATSDGGVILDDDTEQWEGPFTEYTQYGEPSGEQFVKCRDCGREVIAGNEDRATHAAGCAHE